MSESPTVADAQQDTLYVLTLDVVRAGIKTLQGQRIHEHFPGYLYLRRRAMQAGSLADIEADWSEVSDLLRVDGGPSNKPHYRPFSSRNLRDPSGYWYQRNLPGSYAPGSIRATASFMLNATRTGYELPSTHAQIALAQMLRGTRAPAWALAAFYLRDYGFTLEPPGTHDDLIGAFKEEYLFNDGDDFDTLFDAAPPVNFQHEWFEPYVATSQEVSEASEGSAGGINA